MTTVVLSEPDRSTRRLASAALRFAGYSVESARSARHTRTLLYRWPRRNRAGPSR